MFHFAEACVGLATAAVNKEQKYSEWSTQFRIKMKIYFDGTSVKPDLKYIFVFRFSVWRFRPKKMKKEKN